MMDGTEQATGAAAGPSAIQPPAYDFALPKELALLTPRDIGPGASKHGKDRRHDFWRRFTWSPDGTHLLAQSDSHHIDLFYLQQGCQDDDDAEASLVHVFSLRAPSTLLALDWYPFAQYAEPGTWCFAFSARDVPTRLVDAYTGKTRATYAIQDHTERFVGASALAFSLDGTRLYCGHDSNVTAFSLARPGVNTYLLSMALAPSRKAASRAGLVGGQRGAISCLAVAPDHFAGTGSEILAVGTFAGTVGLYRESASENGEGERRDSIHAESICLAGWRETPATGVTQIAFHPTGPHILFVTSRRSTQIQAYDLQYIGSRKSFFHPAPEVALVGVFDRAAESVQKDDGETQQRLYFGLDWAGRFLVSGSTEGQVLVWDIALPGSEANDETRDFFGRVQRRDGQAPVRRPIAQWSAAADAVPCVALHPHLSLACMASGARHWSSAQGNASKSSDDESDDEKEGAPVPMHAKDASLRLLRVARVPD